MKKIILSGGGTGGHIYPAVAVAEALDAEPELPASDATDDNVSDEATHVDVVDPDLVASEEEEMTERQSEGKL